MGVEKQEHTQNRVTVRLLNSGVTHCPHAAQITQPVPWASAQTEHVRSQCVSVHMYCPGLSIRCLWQPESKVVLSLKIRHRGPI